MSPEQKRVLKEMQKIYRSAPGAAFHEKAAYLPESIATAKIPEIVKNLLVRNLLAGANMVARTPIRYVLSDEVAGAAHAISETRTDSLRKIIPHIRLPHENILIEFSEIGRAHFSNIAGSIIAPGKIVPDRTMLIVSSEEGGRRGSMSLFIHFGFGEVVFYPVRVLFDLDDPGFNLSIDHLSRAGIIDAGHKAPSTLPNSRGDQIPSFLEYAKFQQSEYLVGKESVSKTLGESDRAGRMLQDLADEFRFLLSAIGMICLRNGTSVEEEPMSVQKRPGSGSLSRRIAVMEGVDPKIRRMEMSLSHRAPAGLDHPEAAGRGSPGQHWVCGHFKMRKSGIFWWGPHLRGDARRDLTRSPREITVKNPKQEGTPA